MFVQATLRNFQDMTFHIPSFVIQAVTKESKAAVAPTPASGTDVSSLNDKIKVQGDKVRELKSQKADKVFTATNC